jgi:hypothetical protein
VVKGLARLFKRYPNQDDPQEGEKDVEIYSSKNENPATDEQQKVTHDLTPFYIKAYYLSKSQGKL